MLGLSVGGGVLRAVTLRRGRIAWVASATYADLGDLSEVVARLAGEGEHGARRVRIVLERDLVQLRTLDPAPPLKPGAARRHVALQASQLFRNGHGPLITDARLLPIAPRHQVLFAAATPEAVARAVAAGCSQAGLAVESIGPAAEVLPRSAQAGAGVGELVLPLGGGWEELHVARGQVWRARRAAGSSDPAVPWHPALEAVGSDAPAYAAAFAAAAARPSLSLLPPDARARIAQRRARRMRRVAAAAAITWLAALVLASVRAAAVERAASAELAQLGPAAREAASLERDLATTRGALGTLHDAAADRSRSLALLAQLTRTFGDSIALVSLRLGRDSILHLAGYAPVADGVVALLERMPGLRAPRLEGPAARQVVPGGSRVVERDRFAIAARVERWP